MPRPLPLIFGVVLAAVVVGQPPMVTAQVRGIRLGTSGPTPVPVAPPIGPVGSGVTLPTGLTSPRLDPTSVPVSPTPGRMSPGPAVKVDAAGSTAYRNDPPPGAVRVASAPPPRNGPDSPLPDGGGDGSDGSSDGFAAWVSGVPGWMWALLLLLVISLIASRK